MAINSSSSPQRLAGVASLTVAGQTYLLVADAAWRPSKITRESLTGMDGVHGFKETPATGMISATIRDAYGVSVANFNSMVNVSVVMQLANGKTIVGNNMWTVESQEVKSMEATFEVKWEGADVSEQ